MLVNKKSMKISITDILLIAVSAVMFLGINTWFKTCGINGDKIMSCHWAGEMIKVMSLLMTALSLIHLIIPNMHFKTGISLSLMGISAVTLFIPGGIIDLCKMEDMTCRSNTRMWTMILGIIIIVLVVTDMIVYLALASGEKHKRTSERA